MAISVGQLGNYGGHQAINVVFWIVYPGKLFLSENERKRAVYGSFQPFGGFKNEPTSTLRANQRAANPEGAGMAGHSHYNILKLQD